ncbi:tyrosine-protein phosphatase [Acidipila sp. EB88]|uniref:tyrosine-protein phosphatase n=1 Tax=Acidipila sp. EB88 TaxID=2305226 RepID=UPI0018F4A197|nr:CpsB/CapC family capsule biosynthesis tyrosine phosphatase [Acidipila sp. EB88]
MIDIHHHLLPGLDDGSPNMETSVKMAEMAASDGITHIVCTPHANDRFTYSRERNEALLNELRARINGKVTLGLGCDFHMSYDNIQDALDNVGRYSINGGKYVLVEFADSHISETATDSLYELTMVKQRPIITHPERNPVLQRHPEKLAAWIRDGALVQVTASSLSGRFGRTAQATAEKMLKRNWVHFLATDAHNVESRAPIMSQGFEFLRKHYGQSTAERLCIHNPMAVFRSEDWPEQPEALDLDPDASQGQLVTFRKNSFLKRLFG